MYMHHILVSETWILSLSLPCLINGKFDFADIVLLVLSTDRVEKW